MQEAATLGLGCETHQGLSLGLSAGDCVCTKVWAVLQLKELHRCTVRKRHRQNQYDRRVSKHEYMPLPDIRNLFTRREGPDGHNEILCVEQMTGDGVRKTDRCTSRNRPPANFHDARACGAKIQIVPPAQHSRLGSRLFPCPDLR